MLEVEGWVLAIECADDCDDNKVYTVTIGTELRDVTIVGLQYGDVYGLAVGDFVDIGSKKPPEDDTYVPTDKDLREAADAVCDAAFVSDSNPRILSESESRKVDGLIAQVRSHAASCGMTPEQWVRAFNGFVPERGGELL